MEVLIVRTIALVYLILLVFTLFVLTIQQMDVQTTLHVITMKQQTLTTVLVHSLKLVVPV